jgi:hypothetical protein
MMGCNRCKSQDICIECDEIEYTLIDNECKNISELGDKYYRDENTSRYKMCKEGVEYCERCKNENECLKCFENYTRIDNKNSSCHLIEDLGDGYYPDPDDDTNYKSCSDIIEECKTCNSLGICTSCIEGFGLYKDDNICVNIKNDDYYKNDTDNRYYPCNLLKGCNKCKSKDFCIECDEIEYTLIDNNCRNISELGDRYYRDENTSSYKMCEEGVEYCERCKNGKECKKCFENYTKIDNINSSCHLIEDLDDKYYPDPDDDTNYKSCSYLIDNCISCNSSQCFLCKDGYIFINDNFSECYLKSSINLSDYFTNDNITYYSCKDERYKNEKQCLKAIETSIPNFHTTIPLTMASTSKTPPIINHTTIIMLETLLPSSPKNIPSDSVQTTYTNNMVTTEKYDDSDNHDNTDNLENTDDSNTDVISTTDKSSSLPLIPKNPYPFPTGINTIFFLQAQFIKGHLYIYVIADFVIKDMYYFNINIILVYSTHFLRHIEEKSNNIIIGLNSANIKGNDEVICLSSDDINSEFGSNDIIGVKVENIIPMNNNTKSTFNINLNNNKQYLDTQKTESLIKNGAIDFKQIVENRPDYKANLYKIESINSGCEFSLVTNKKIKEINKSINLLFQNNKINSETNNVNCLLSSQNNNKINCTLNDNINSNVTIEDYLSYDNDGLTAIYLPVKSTEIPLSCQNYRGEPQPSPPQKNKKLIIIIIAAGGILLIIITTIILCCCCCRKKKNSISDNSMNKTNNAQNTIGGWESNMNNTFHGSNEFQSSTKQANLN